MDSVQAASRVDAKAFLQQVEKLDTIIRNKLIEKEQWRDMALGITANMDGERVQSSGSQQRMADAVNKCIDMEAEIDRLIDKLIDTKKDVISTIEQLDIPREYDCLFKHYIQFKSYQEIADEYGQEYSTVTTLHGRAIANLQKILDERWKTRK